jgi:hypothetical protein
MSMPKTGRIDLDTKPVTGESDQGAASDATRQSDSTPSHTLGSLTASPRRTGRDRKASPFFFRFR